VPEGHLLNPLVVGREAPSKQWILLISDLDNDANHRQQKVERRRSGAFCCPSVFALLGELFA